MIYKGIEWKIYKGVLLPVTPQHYSINLSYKEQKELLKLSKVHLIRWTDNWDKAQPTNYWYIIKDNFKGFDEYSTGTRNQVRKGLKNCYIQKIDASFLIQNGYEIYKKAFLHYKKKDVGVNSIPSESSFSNYYATLDGISDFWGVFENESNKFIAFAENVVRDHGVIYGAMRFDPDYMKKYPSYALIHTMNQYYLEELQMNYVSDGPRSLFHETTIQEMLVRVFKFRKAYCNLNIAFSPFLKSTVRMLFPFRKLIYSINQKKFKEISTVLKMEEIVKRDEQ